MESEITLFYYCFIRFYDYYEYFLSFLLQSNQCHKVICTISEG